MDITKLEMLSSFIDPTWTSWSTIWSAIGAIGTLAASGAILYAARQLQFDAWIHIQDKWNDPVQRELRKTIFERREDNTKTDWKPDELKDANNVCGRMDEFARLVKFTNRKDIIEIWHIPISKLWDVLEEIVNKERLKHPSKWDAFESLAKDCLKRRNKK